MKEKRETYDKALFRRDLCPCCWAKGDKKYAKPTNSRHKRRKQRREIKTLDIQTL